MIITVGGPFHSLCQSCMLHFLSSLLFLMYKSPVCCELDDFFFSFFAGSLRTPTLDQLDQSMKTMFEAAVFNGESHPSSFHSNIKPLCLLFKVSLFSHFPFFYFCSQIYFFLKYLFYSFNILFTSTLRRKEICKS